jgi:DNA-binding MarR family transcriptional regulator
MLLTTHEASLDDLDRCIVDVRRFWHHSLVQRRFKTELGVPGDMSLLRTMRAINEATGEVCVGDVASGLLIDASTASRMVDQAVNEGYVVRTTSREDRRRSTLRLSATGVDLLSRAYRVRRTVLGELTAGWSQADITTLASLLSRLLGNLDTLEPEVERDH